MTMQSSCIKIGSRTYSVASIDDQSFDLVLQQRNIDDTEIKSFVDYDDQVVLVRERLHDDHKRELILHELLHVCFQDSGVDDQSLENFIAILSPRLVQIVNELPALLKRVSRPVPSR